MAKVAAVIPLDFLEAIAWAKQRGVELPADYYGERIGLARARAFTVSNMTVLDQIQQVFDSLNEALAKGQTFRDWKKTLPDEALALPKARQELVFRNALQNAYGAGRWEQQTGNTDRPYLMYDAINDSRTRPNHKALDGIIRPAADEFWKAHYPPNGHNCRCSVIALTPEQAKARGGAHKPVPPEGSADKGWNYNPGQAFDDHLAKLAKAKEDKAPEPVKKAVRTRKPPDPTLFSKRVKAAYDKCVKAPTVENVKALGWTIADEIAKQQEALDLKSLRAMQAGNRAKSDALATERKKLPETILFKPTGQDEYKRVTLDETSLKDGGYTDITLRRLEEKTERAFQALGGVAPESLKKLVFTNERAHADVFGTGNINVGGDTIETILHEIGHFFEKDSATLGKLSVEFRNSLAQIGDDGKPIIKKLSEITGIAGYGDNEVAMVGNYIDPYFGKVYQAARITEVLSMALQMLPHAEGLVHNAMTYSATPWQELSRFALGMWALIRKTGGKL
jgi:SPP1 gp7 family putative phage head morphogenesis protein